MFELLGLAGSPEQGIALETRLRRSIENSQAADPGARSHALFSHLMSLHPNWELRKHSCGIYNCFGHIWAARRTSILDQPAIETILRDDGYRRLAPQEHPMLGDIALFYDPSGTYLWHAGLVSELRRLVTASNQQFGAPAIWVLSKLNEVLGEVLHNSNDVHSPYGADPITVVFLTDRP